MSSTGIFASSGRGARQENIEDDRPVPILHSMTGMYGAFDRINELADGPHLVVAGHDPEVLTRFPPLTGPLSGRVAVIAP
ncbi:hypothetical protein [Nonomuraea sp. NPDC048901]|uniref:hypothetical protein n=1 Tax=Nonomuraea sp. NPDC048901 TaxID=3155627 RepID=UPI0033F5EB7D